ncbi:CBS domain-containing protein [candidate division KSB1 bacterium]
MDIKKVSDIMIPLDAYPHVPYWFTLRQSLIVFSKARLEIDNTISLPRAILVFDKEYKLLGMVRRRDIFRGFGREFPTVNTEKIEDPDFVEKVAENLKSISSKQVLDVMVPIKKTANWDEYITGALHKMVDNEVSILPVLQDDKVVGVVRSVELLDEISSLVLEKAVRNVL